MNKFIPISEPSITQKEIDYVTDAVKSGWVSSLGKYIAKFEKKFAKYIGVKYALTTANGTAALHLALLSLEINKRDEIIIPDFTFIATANAVTYTGAKPIMVDIEEDTWCINPENIKKAITPETKAIIPVHIYGHPCDMNSIMKIAKKYNLFVVEDAAEAHGAEYKNRKVGSIGDIGCFSFYGNKVITTGEGGMITTNHKKIYEKAKFLRDHVMSKNKRYWHTKIGYNYRITNLQAALGLAQLERINELIKKKRRVFKWYEKYLSNTDGIELNPQKEWAKNIYWMVCLVMKKDFGISRDKLMIKLKNKGIDSRPFFYPISNMPMYKNNRFSNSVTEELSKKGLILPSGVDLNKIRIEYICQRVKEILK